MKQKGKSPETMVCSKRKDKRNSITKVKHNHENSKTQADLKNELSHKILENNSNGFVNCSNVIIVSAENKSSEKTSTNLEDHKITPTISELDDCTKNDEIEFIPNEILASSENCQIHDFRDGDLKENKDTGNDTVEEVVTSEVDRMSSPSSAKAVSGGRTNHLCTILENVKGEEKEIKRSSVKETKVQKDKGLNSHVCTDDKTNHQSAQRIEKEMHRVDTGCSVNSPNMDIIKKTKDANEHSRIDRLTNRQPSNEPSNKRETNENNINSRPSSSKTDPGSSRNSAGPGKKTKKIYSGIRFTKQELDYYLPKRSNFSCHEKALKDAGLDLDEIKTTRRPRFRRTRLSLEDSDIDIKLKSVEDANVVQENVQDNETDHNDLEDEQTEIERAKMDKSKRKGKKRSDETEVKVDHTVLLQYLKYVHDNQEDYLTHKKQVHQHNTTLLNIDPTCTIARFGRAFQRGQHGTLGESFLLEVVHGIKSNFGDATHWVSPAKDKQGTGTGHVLKVEQSETNIDEKDKTDYEKVKLKLDKWLKTITASQLQKAKELALKELGEEDKLQSKWWATLQPCRYLRQRTTLN